MTKEKFNIYELVTNKIIEKLEQGVVPWKKPWNSSNGPAVNWKTQTPYRGINVMLLEPGEYLTFKQVQEAGGKVKKGAQSEIVVFWKWIEKEDEETGETEKIPFLKYYRVFNINQCEGIESKRNEKIETYEHDPIEEVENIVKGYINKPSLSWERTGAWYKPSIDLVNVPPMSDFPKAEEYAQTMFHELIHSTGHVSRLNRDGITGTHKFGSMDYSREELVAEIGGSMLAAVTGIDNVTFDNSASYIQNWLKVLKNDKKMIVKAGAQAQKAVDYILGVSYKENN